MSDQAVNCEANTVSYLTECICKLTCADRLLPICESEQRIPQPNPATQLQIPYIISSTGDDWSLRHHQLASEVVFQDWGRRRLRLLIRAAFTHEPRIVKQIL